MPITQAFSTQTSSCQLGSLVISMPGNHDTRPAYVAQLVQGGRDAPECKVIRLVHLAGMAGRADQVMERPLHVVGDNARTIEQACDTTKPTSNRRRDRQT